LPAFVWSWPGFREEPWEPSWLPVFLFGYLLVFLAVRAWGIARPARALARAQLLGLWAEYGARKRASEERREEGPLECVRLLLEEAASFLGVDLGSRTEGGNGARLEAQRGSTREWWRIRRRCATELLSLLVWAGSGEMAAWRLMHRAERRAVHLMSAEEVRVRLLQAQAELDEFGDGELAAFWQEWLVKALGDGGWPGGPGAGEGSGEADALVNQRALLASFLAHYFDARDNKFDSLLALQNRGTFLLVVGLGLAFVLTALELPALQASFGVAFLLGFLGGGLSRLVREVSAGRLPTDYGAYWVPLFLAPVLGGLAAIGGYVLFGALVGAEIIGGGVSRLEAPPGVYGLLFAFGFSERLLRGLTRRLEQGLVPQQVHSEAAARKSQRRPEPPSPA
jgi:hypothetical protein